MNKLQSIAAPGGRILISFMFIYYGLTKIGSYTGTQGYMEAMGVPGALLPLVIAFEILGGQMNPKKDMVVALYLDGPRTQGVVLFERIP